MASVGHVAIGLAAGRLWCRDTTEPGSRHRWMLRLTALSFLPDADVIAFALGIPYAHPWGHRGASHSVAFAAIVAAFVVVIVRSPRWGRSALFALTFAVVASHGVLDAMTDGGLGIAFAWPWSDARHFLPWRPIPVAPIGPGLLSPRGLMVATTETLMFAPLLLYALWPRRDRLPT